MGDFPCSVLDGSPEWERIATGCGSGRSRSAPTERQEPSIGPRRLGRTARGSARYQRPRLSEGGAWGADTHCTRDPPLRGRKCALPCAAPIGLFPGYLMLRVPFPTSGPSAPESRHPRDRRVSARCHLCAVSGPARSSRGAVAGRASWRTDRSELRNTPLRSARSRRPRTAGESPGRSDHSGDCSLTR
jgi:hypothetical protein